MRSKEIDIAQFATIIDIYSFVDNNAHKLAKNWDLTDIWIKYRDKTLSEDEKQKAQWEIDYFIFDLKGNMLFSQVYSETTQTGEVQTYPDLNKFQKESIENLKIRAENASNPILKARYNHLLWKTPVGIKHNKYAFSASENYISAIEIYLNQYKIDQHEETPLLIGRLYETLLSVANDVKSDLEPLKKLTNLLLFDPDFKFYAKHGILDDMLEYPKLFKPADFENTLSIIEQNIKKDTTKSDDFLSVINYIPTALKIAKKIKSDQKMWFKEAGLAYLRMGESETEVDRFGIKQLNYAEAIKYFVLADEKQKAQWEIDYFIFDLKGNMLFSQVYSETTQTGEVQTYPDLNKFQKESIENLKIRAENASNPTAKTNALEKEIDELIYQLYELTEEEIKIVEGK